MSPLETGLLLALLGLYGKIIVDVTMARRNRHNPNGQEARLRSLEEELIRIRLRLHEFGSHIATLLERTRHLGN